MDRLVRDLVHVIKDGRVKNINMVDPRRRRDDVIVANQEVIHHLLLLLLLLMGEIEDDERRGRRRKRGKGIERNTEPQVMMMKVIDAKEVT